MPDIGLGGCRSVEHYHFGNLWIYLVEVGVNLDGAERRRNVTQTLGGRIQPGHEQDQVLVQCLLQLVCHGTDSTEIETDDLGSERAGDGSHLKLSGCRNRR